MRRRTWVTLNSTIHSSFFHDDSNHLCDDHLVSLYRSSFVSRLSSRLFKEKWIIFTTVAYGDLLLSVWISLSPFHLSIPPGEHSIRRKTCRQMSECLSCPYSFEDEEKKTLIRTNTDHLFITSTPWIPLPPLKKAGCQQKF